MKKALLLTFDVEEFVTPIEKKMPVSKNEMFSYGAQGLKEILILLSRLKCRATFFVTAEFSLRFPDLTNAISESGSELASHGYSHEHRYGSFDFDTAVQYLSSARKILSRHSREKVVGFRSPQMNHPDYSAIKKAGYTYDSSYHPTFVPGRYNNLFGSRRVFNSDGLIIVPVSVTPVLRLPLSWIWFRNFGRMYAQLGTRWVLSNSNFINLYFHSWEFVTLHRAPFKRLYLGLVTRHSGAGMVSLLSQYILKARRLGLVDKTIREVIDENKGIL